MAYNYMNSVNNILNYKSQWDAGDDDEKRKAHKRALTEYDNLIKNGYSDIADRLKASDTAMATDYTKSLNTAGKTHVRPYLVNGLTGKYGLSQQEANDLITWNPDTHEVNLGAINLGRGDAEYDGKSYFSDTGKLDKALEDWAASTGRNISPELRFNQLMNQAEASYDEGQKYRDDAYKKYNEVVGWIGDDRKDLQGKYNDYIDWIGTPYYETGEYDRIMDQYRELGNNAGYSAIAGSAGSNGGNVDSYAAAQAARQLKSFENAGNAAAREWWTAKADKLLGGIGALADYNNDTYTNMNTQADRILNLQNYSDASGDKYSQLGQDVFNANEVAQNNAAQRDYMGAQTYALYNDTNRQNAESEAEITGKTPMELDPLYKQIFDERGNLRDGWENRNFLALAQDAAANGNENDAAIYLAARDRKMADNWSRYGQFAGDEVPDVRYTPSDTFAHYKYDTPDATTKYTDDTQYNIADRQAQADEYGYRMENDWRRHTADKDAEWRMYASDNDVTIAGIMAEGNARVAYLNEAYPAYTAALVTALNGDNLLSNAGRDAAYSRLLNIPDGQSIGFTRNDFENLFTDEPVSVTGLAGMTELVLGMLENGKSVSPALMSGLVKKWGEVPESSGSEDTTGTAGTAGGNSYLNNGATSSGGYSYLGDGGNSPASPALDEEYWSGTDTRGYFTVDADGTAEPTSKGKNKGLNNTGAAYMRAIESYIEGNEAQGAATTNEIANFINTNILPYQYDREQLRRVCDIYGISTYGI